MRSRKLELIRWTCAAICAVIVVARLWNPALGQGGLGVLLFFTFVVVGFSAAMISLQLHGAKWLGSGKDEK
jgi:hypothetical protein